MNKYHLTSYKKIIFLLISLFAFLTEGCRPVKEIKPTPDIPYYKPEVILEHLATNQSDFEWFSARFTGNVLWGNQNHNISGTIRIKKDEAIYISLSPVLGIEIARAIVTPDTVKYLNRLESTYYIGHIGFINSMLRTSLDYNMLQAILVGNDFANYQTDSFTTSEEDGLIMLHDPKRQSLNNHPGHQPLIFNHYLWVDPENHKIRKNLVTEKSVQRSIKAEYDNFQQIGGEKIPAKIDLMISDPGYHADLSLQYLRITLNEPQRMNFTVPSRYEPIDFE